MGANESTHAHDVRENPPKYNKPNEWIKDVDSPVLELKVDSRGWEREFSDEVVQLL